MQINIINLCSFIFNCSSKLFLYQEMSYYNVYIANKQLEGVQNFKVIFIFFDHQIS